MKLKIYHFAIALFFVFSGCSKDEEFSTIRPIDIAFVHADGTEIAVGECINPFENYAILIRTKSDGNGSVKASVIEYTVNGLSHSMTFMNEGTQINKITLGEGLNTAKIVGDSLVATLNYASQIEFELVK